MITHWHDTATGVRTLVRARDGNLAFTLRHTYPDATAAGNAAQARLDRLNRRARGNQPD
uniref:Uncharacterized protein n=1 Tax=Candidatus Kentrum eta TaxID=2126337 RepID=A0A450V149_9GAMM|nr:MAG: hypothetical protein BECKH772A_GA0070896_101385 [Candidatus Kentron sp. H]VFJ98653.1 MAG: hypothetical protein BECKH772B_GA0070898_101394 [Candidatus Kentron sp. H]VFK03567.1 MAG: hypothetical protein BECKH772C_GA0070978_101354 [Candidatus Kentron sp. H]